MISIRHRLLVLLLGLWTTLWFAVSLITLNRSGHEIAELFDAQLAQTAHVLHDITLAGNLPDFATLPQQLSAAGHPYEYKISFQLWRGEELVSAFGGAAAGALTQTPGFSDQDVLDSRWRVFGLPTAQPDEMLLVAQNYTIRQELIWYLTIHAMEPVLWSLPLTVLLIWFGVTDGLRPLSRLARDVERRSAQRLTPVDKDMVPREIRPLIDALNALMERLGKALSTERRFAADAAHELRTPLAVIRTHAQVAQRARNPEERAEAIDQLLVGVDRTTHLVAQLLRMVRLEPDSAEVDQGVASLVDVVREVLEDHRAAAQAKSLELIESFSDDHPCVVAVDRASLAILVANLVDNAIKYTPEGGWLRIMVTEQDGAIQLRVEDSGPGIPSVERQRVFDRFYRRAGQDQPGAGLGLSMVQRICELNEAQIQLLDGQDESGLAVQVSFQPPML